MIKVLIVDDSPTASLAIRQNLESDRDIHVIGEAENGETALRLIQRYDPDIVTMDVHLRRENGITLTSSIMATSPRPILIVTGVNPKDPQLMYRALDAGALDVISKPSGPLSRRHDKERTHLVRLVKTLAKVPVVHRFSRAGQGVSKDRSSVSGGPAKKSLTKERTSTSDTPDKKYLFDSETPSSTYSAIIGARPSQQVILIGASTGGPKVVSSLLSEIPRPYIYPIIVIQHISSGFSEGFAEWLASVTKHKTLVVNQSTRLRAGEVYVAPDDYNLRFVSQRDIARASSGASNLHVPSYDVLLESAAAYRISAVAIIMTGMGSDGTRGLKESRGILSLTIAQSPASCVVDGMPNSAIRANLIDKVLDPSQIAKFLCSLDERTRRVTTESNLFTT